MKKLYLIYFVCAALIALIYYSTCGSYNKTIDRMKKDLTSHYSEKDRRYVDKKDRKNRAQYGSWVTDYVFELDDDELDVRETLTLSNKGSFSELREYFYDGQLVATCQFKGKWDIDYEDKDFIFNQDYDDYIDIENVGFNDYWFKRFDTEVRVSMKEVDGSDEDESSGAVIVDCSPKAFSIKYIDDDLSLNYEPAAS